LREIEGKMLLHFRLVVVATVLALLAHARDPLPMELDPESTVEFDSAFGTEIAPMSWLAASPPLRELLAETAQDVTISARRELGRTRGPSPFRLDVPDGSSGSARAVPAGKSIRYSSQSDAGTRGPRAALHRESSGADSFRTNTPPPQHHA
jgi:hypothetical protein